MTLFAFTITGGRFDDPVANVVLWGSAAAAAVAALMVVTRGPAVVAWAAIGYILFAGLLALPEPSLLIASLGLALMPVVQRPRESLALGLLIAAVVALAFKFVPLL